MHTKSITYSAATRDYDAALDGEYIGSFENHHEAEIVLDALVCELLASALLASEATYARPAEVAEPVYVPGEAPMVALCRDCASAAALRGGLGKRLSEYRASPVTHCAHCAAHEAPTACYALKDSPIPAQTAAPASLPVEPHAPAAQTAAHVPSAQEPTLLSATTDHAVASALEQLAEREAQAARHARERAHCPALTEAQAEEQREEAKFFQRAANAYTRALLYWDAGVRPTRTPGGGYVLPSQRQGEAPHLLTFSGDWCCTCPAGASAHWAKMLIIGLEVGMDALDAGTVGADDAGLPAGDEAEIPPPDYARAQAEIDELF